MYYRFFRVLDVMSTPCCAHYTHCNAYNILSASIPLYSHQSRVAGSEMLRTLCSVVYHSPGIPEVLVLEVLQAVLNPADADQLRLHRTASELEQVQRASAEEAAYLEVVCWSVLHQPCVPLTDSRSLWRLASER